MTGSGVQLHYEFTGFKTDVTGQSGENKVNLTTAVQKQQNLNMTNPSLQPDGNTYCNFATQNVLETVQSATDNNGGLTKLGQANGVVPKLENSTLFQSVDKATALTTASNGGLAVLGCINPNFNENGTQKHGHLATFSVGENVAKGQVANIASENGFKAVSAEDGSNHIFSAAAAGQVKYFTLAPFVTPKVGPSFGPVNTTATPH